MIMEENHFQGQEHQDEPEEWTSEAEDLVMNQNVLLLIQCVIHIMQTTYLILIDLTEVFQVVENIHIN